MKHPIRKQSIESTFSESVFIYIKMSQRVATSLDNEEASDFFLLL